MNERTTLPTYCVTLLPSLQVVAIHATLPEAVAYMETYNEIMAGTEQRAVIDSTSRWQAAA